MSITTKDFIDQIAVSGDLTKAKAGQVLDELLAFITDSLESGEDVILKKVGRLYLKERPARKGRNPRTGEEINIPAKTVVKFSARGSLK